MARTNENFEVWQGDKRTLDIAVDGIEDLFGMSLYWALADGPGRAPLVQKTEANDITFTDNVMHIVLNPDDTVDLTAREYYHEAKVVDAVGGGGVVVSGKVYVRPASLKAV